MTHQMMRVVKITKLYKHKTETIGSPEALFTAKELMAQIKTKETP